MHTSDTHESVVLDEIERLDEDVQRVLEVGMRLTGPAGTEFYPLDLLAYGALKRNLSTTSAIVLLVENFNLVSARALLRVHIDTALRFSAAWFVDHPQAFAAAIHAGARIDKVKDSQGMRLTDSRLVELLAPQCQWLPTVYERLSAYIHLSGSHIATSITSFEEESGRVTFYIGKEDRHFPASSWVEVLRCAREATTLLLRYVEGYIVTKAMSPEEAAKAKTEATRHPPPAEKPT